MSVVAWFAAVERDLARRSADRERADLTGLRVGRQGDDVARRRGGAGCVCGWGRAQPGQRRHQHQREAAAQTGCGHGSAGADQGVSAAHTDDRGRRLDAHRRRGQLGDQAGDVGEHRRGPASA